MKFTRNGFIKPNGIFISTQPQGHESYLYKLRKKGVQEDFDNWIKVSESFSGVYIFCVENWDRHLQRPVRATQAQLDTLFSWAKKFGHVKEYTDFLERNDYI